MKPPGIIIALEGGDGSGKSSVGKHLVDTLKAVGKSALHVPIIESSAVGAIYKRNYLFGKGVTPVREAAGMLTSVLDTLETVVKPARKMHDVIVLDRSLASFATYQLGVNGYEWARPMFEQALLNPDFIDYTTVYLEVDPEEGLRRITAGRESADIVERRGPEYQRKIHAGYEASFRRYPVLAPTLRIDTMRTKVEDMGEVFLALIDGVLTPQAA